MDIWTVCVCVCFGNGTVCRNESLTFGIWYYHQIESELSWIVGYPVRVRELLVGGNHFPQATHTHTHNEIEYRTLSRTLEFPKVPRWYPYSSMVENNWRRKEEPDKSTEKKLKGSKEIRSVRHYQRMRDLEKRWMVGSIKSCQMVKQGKNLEGFIGYREK